MASFEQNKQSKLWSVRYRVIEGGHEAHKRQSGFRTKKDAQTWYLKNFESDTCSRPNLTMKELTDEFLAERKPNVKYSSYVALKNHIDLYINDFFQKVKDIEPISIIKWQNYLTEKGLSYKYKSNIRTTLYSILKYATNFGFNNPLEKVKGFKRLEKKKEMLFWTEDEFKDFLTAVDRFSDRVLFIFMYVMGSRKGETLALTWQDIDFNSATVHFNKTITKHSENGNAWEITPPKTQNGIRDNAIPDNLLDLLREYKKTATGEFVFEGERPIAFNTLRCRFIAYIKKAQEAAISENRQPIKYIRIHDLRHSCVSYMINHGQNEIATIYIIAQWIGDTVEQIYKTYGHLFPNHQEKIVAEWEKIRFE